MMVTREIVGTRPVTETPSRPRTKDVLGIVLALLIGVALAVLAVVLFVANYSVF